MRKPFMIAATAEKFGHKHIGFVVESLTRLRAERDRIASSITPELTMEQFEWITENIQILVYEASLQVNMAQHVTHVVGDEPGGASVIKEWQGVRAEAIELIGACADLCKTDLTGWIKD